ITGYKISEKISRDILNLSFLFIDLIDLDQAFVCDISIAPRISYQIIQMLISFKLIDCGTFNFPADGYAFTVYRKVNHILVLQAYITVEEAMLQEGIKIDCTV